MFSSLFCFQSISVEANILLAKLYYSQMRFDEANIIFGRDSIQSAMHEQIKCLKLQQSADPLQSIKANNLRQLQLFAEAHSIRGLCSEKRRLNNLAGNRDGKSWFNHDFINIFVIDQ